MKIKIVKPRGWYTDRIGEIFIVNHIRDHDGCYMVIDNHPSNYGGQLSYVFKEDCVEVNNCQ